MVPTEVEFDGVTGARTATGSKIRPTRQIGWVFDVRGRSPFDLEASWQGMLMYNYATVERDTRR